MRRLTLPCLPPRGRYPDGYSGHSLNASDRADLLACTAALQFAYEARFTDGEADELGLSVRIDTADETEQDVAVELIDSNPYDDSLAGATLAVEGDDWSRTLHLVRTGLDADKILEARVLSDLEPDDDGVSPMGEGRPVAVQVVERGTLGWSLSAFGSYFDVLARRPRFAELDAHMKPPPRSALDDSLLSPMPGVLLSLGVSAGDHVHIGQELCVVEAMKMQNVLTASRDGVVSALMAEPGTTLAADQPIIAFEAEAE